LDFDATGGTTVIRHSVSEYLLRSLHSVTAPRRFFYWLCLRAATGLFRTEPLRRLPNLFYAVLRSWDRRSLWTGFRTQVCVSW